MPLATPTSVGLAEEPRGHHRGRRVAVGCRRSRPRSGRPWRPGRRWRSAPSSGRTAAKACVSAASRWRRRSAGSRRARLDGCRTGRQRVREVAAVCLEHRRRAADGLCDVDGGLVAVGAGDPADRRSRATSAARRWWQRAPRLRRAGRSCGLVRALAGFRSGRRRQARRTSSSSSGPAACAASGTPASASGKASSRASTTALADAASG